MSRALSKQQEKILAWFRMNGYINRPRHVTPSTLAKALYGPQADKRRIDSVRTSLSGLVDRGELAVETDFRPGTWSPMLKYCIPTRW